MRLKNSQSVGLKLPKCRETHALIPLFIGVSVKVIEHITDDQEAHRKIEEKDDILKLYQHVESKLSTRERLVLKMRYGLYNEEEYTQREIAKLLGISRSYVSRIEKSAIEKLRGYF